MLASGSFCRAAGRYRAGHRAFAQGRLQGRRADSRRRGLRPQAERSGRRAGEDHDSEGRISRRDGAEERASGGGDSCRVAAQRNRRHLLGEEHVLARQVGGALRASGALAGVAARRRSCAAGVCRHSRRSRQRRPSHSVVGSAGRSTARRNTLRRWPKASVVASAAEREQRIRKALDAATRTIPGARWREDKSLLDTVVNLTEFPSVVLGSFDPEFLALADEVLVTVMRDHQKYFALEDAERQTAAAFSRGAEHRRRSRRTDSPRQRARAARPLQRRALLLGDRPEDSAAPARGHAEGGDLPERPGQLLRQDHARAEARQPDLGGDSQCGRSRYGRASSSRRRCWPRPTSPPSW